MRVVTHYTNGGLHVADPTRTLVPLEAVHQRVRRVAFLPPGHVLRRLIRVQVNYSRTTHLFRFTLRRMSFRT